MNPWLKIGGALAAFGVALWGIKQWSLGIAKAHGQQETEIVVERLSAAKHDDFARGGLAKHQQVKFPSKHKPKPILAAALRESSFTRHRSQLFVRNRSNVDRVITLWGSPDAVSLAVANPMLVEDHAVVDSIGTHEPILNHPQGIASVGNTLVVASQLNDSMVVLDEGGKLMATVPLEDAPPGAVSPCSIAWNAHTGHYYLGGTTTAGVWILNSAYTVVDRITTPDRPSLIKVNPRTGHVYILNRFSKSVTILAHTTHEQLATHSLPGEPLDLDFRTDTGLAIIACENYEGVLLLEHAGAIPSLLPLPACQPVGMSIFIERQALLLVCENSNQLIELSLETFVVLEVHPIGADAQSVAVHPINQHAYVAHPARERFSVVDLNNGHVVAVEAPGLASAWLIDAVSGSVLYTRPSHNDVAVLGFDPLVNSIELSGDYNEFRANIQNNPVRLDHLKWLQGDGRLVQTLEVADERPTGGRASFRVGLAEFQSPQQVIPVAELTAAKGWIIDHHTRWRFVLPAGQSATILMYYHQWKRSQLAGQTSSKTNQHD